MSRKQLPKLPDLEEEDSVFQRKMRPLVEQALPKDRKPVVQHLAEFPRRLGSLRCSGMPDIRLSRKI